MIVIRLNGGLGNQMFQYAAGKAAALKSGETLFLDSTYLEHYPFNARITRRKFELDFFNVNESKWITNEKLFKLAQNKYLYNALHHFNLKRSRLKEVKEENYLNDSLVNNYLIGSFQSEIFFKEVRPSILNDFTLRIPVSEKNKAVAKMMHQNESVSIHIRRGDYLLSHHLAHHGILGLDYYKKAIERMASSYEKLKFFVFSDDLDWARENLTDTRFEFNYVGHNTGENSYMDLWLMSQCKSNIIANSSFSWWGAWLNENEDKQVIYPAQWFAGTAKEKASPSSWIKI